MESFADKLIKWRTRQSEIVALRNQGLTWSAIGAMYRLTPQRVKQIYDKAVKVR